MLNTDVFIRYQAYGCVINTLKDNLNELKTQRPAVNTVTKLLGDAAAQCRKRVRLNDIERKADLADVIAWKLDNIEREKYLEYIADCTYDCLIVLKRLNRPTRTQIDTTLGQVLHKVKAAMFPIQLVTAPNEQNV